MSGAVGNFDPHKSGLLYLVNSLKDFQITKERPRGPMARRWTSMLKDRKVNPKIASSTLVGVISSRHICVYLFYFVRLNSGFL